MTRINIKQFNSDFKSAIDILRRRSKEQVCDIQKSLDHSTADLRTALQWKTYISSVKVFTKIGKIMSDLVMDMTPYIAEIDSLLVRMNKRHETLKEIY